jgi:hypothetical protein
VVNRTPGEDHDHEDGIQEEQGRFTLRAGDDLPALVAVGIIAMRTGTTSPACSSCLSPDYRRQNSPLPVRFRQGMGGYYPAAETPTTGK